MDWTVWPDGTTNAQSASKGITFAEAYSKADADGKTWPNDPQSKVQVSADVDVTVTFLGWYTSKNIGEGTKIEPCAIVGVTGSLTLYPHFDYERTEVVKEKIEIVLEAENANDYTMDSMQYVDDFLKVILAPDYEITQADVDELQRRMDLLEPVEADNADGGDMTPPTVSVYENKAALRKAIKEGTFRGDADDIAYMLSDETGETSYVYPGKAYYTYYCYTNSTQPAIMLSAKDVMGRSGRVSYPVTFSMYNDPSNPDDMNGAMVRTRSGKVNSGWMNYTEDPTDKDDPNYNPNRTADWKLGRNAVENPYKSALTYFGRNYDGSGYAHYMYEEYILLKPTFDASYRGKQYALYTFEVNDDSVGDLAADTSILAGAEGTTLVDTDLTTTGNATITPTNTVTIFVEYNNTMVEGRTDAGGQVVNASTGVGTYNGGALEVYNNFHENGYQNNVWVNQDYLYRNAAGIANTDFVTPLFAEDGTYKSYIANDPIYGQTDVGSFYYLMKSTDPATVKYWEEYDAYLAKNPGDYHGARVAGATAGGEEAAVNLMKQTVAADMQNETVRAKMNNTPSQSCYVTNGDYVYWPYTTSTQWSTMFYAPARTREDTLVYVHIYDRWGNTYTNILQRDLQDTQAAEAAQIARGEVVVNELGGSQIANITIYELNTQKKVNVSGMTDGQVWNVENNSFTITGLPAGNNDYCYTMKITDGAGSEQSFNFQANADGSVTITINDETMGGGYAAAAAQPLAGSTGTDPANGISVGAIEEAALTTMSIEEVDAETIAADTIGEAQPAGEEAPEETERPDVYTFKVNDVYTVNLFASTERDYEVTLKSTVGGIVKAYVNGAFTAPKAGKVAIPAGAQVQIRVSARAGYELESLTMVYPDGRTTDLVGAYNAEIDDDVTIKAVFAQTAALLTVRVENGAVSGQQEVKVSPYSRVAVVAEQAPEGKVFAYWVQDGDEDVPVSFEEIYTFIVMSDVTLKAVYADAPVAATANITMDAASAAQVTVVNGKYTLSYSGRITLPEGAQIEEFGLLLTNQSADSCTAENFVIGGQVNGVNVAKLAGQTLTEEGQCKINVNNVAAGQTRTGRLYLTVKLADGSTQTIYSNTWSELSTPAA